MRKLIWFALCFVLAACGTFQVGIETSSPPDATITTTETPIALPPSPSPNLPLQIDRLSATLIANTAIDGARFYALSFSPDGQYLAAMETAQTNLWDVSGLQGGGEMLPARFFPSRGDGAVCQAPVFSPDSRSLVVCGNGNETWIWDVQRGEKTQTLSSDEEPITFAYHPAGNLLAVVASPSRIDFWNVQKNIWEAPILTDMLMNQIAFTPDGKCLVSVGANGGQVNLWDTQGQQPVSKDYPGMAHGFAVNPMGDRLVIASDTGDYPLYELENGTLAATLCPTKACYSYDTSFAFSPDGRLLATADGNSSLPVRVWDVSTGQMLLELESGRHVAFHPGGRLLAVASEGNVHIWRLDDAQPAGTLPAMPQPQPSPTTIPIPSQAQSQQLGELTLIEYPLIPAQADLSNDYDLQARVASSIYDAFRQDGLFEVEPSLTVSEINAIIQPFGYTLQGKTSPYRLSQGNKVLREVWVLPSRQRFSINPAKTDFVWGIHDSVYDGWLIHGEAIEESYAFSSNFFITPQFLNGSLLTVHNNSLADEPGIRLQVTLNDQIIYSQSVNGNATDCPVERLTVWDGHWILDMTEQVVIDGELLNEKLERTAIFEWLLLHGKPLYFFRHGERDGLNYAGEVLPIQYDEIKHDCLSVNDGLGTHLRIFRGDNIVGFYARRDGMWYFVTLEPTTPAATQVSYASSAAQSGCAIPAGQQIHLHDEAYLWPEADVNHGEAIQLLNAGASLYILDGPVQGNIVKNSDQQGWFWQVSLTQGGESAGWLWQNRIQECPY